MKKIYIMALLFITIIFAAFLLGVFIYATDTNNIILGFLSIFASFINGSVFIELLNKFNNTNKK